MKKVLVVLSFSLVLVFLAALFSFRQFVPRVIKSSPTHFAAASSYTIQCPYARDAGNCPYAQKAYESCPYLRKVCSPPKIKKAVNHEVAVRITHSYYGLP